MYTRQDLDKSLHINRSILSKQNLPHVNGVKDEDKVMQELLSPVAKPPKTNKKAIPPQIVPLQQRKELNDLNFGSSS